MKPTIEAKVSELADLLESERAPWRPSGNVAARRSINSILGTLGLITGGTALFGGVVAMILHSVISNDRTLDGIATDLVIVAAISVLFGLIFWIRSKEINEETRRIE